MTKRIFALVLLVAVAAMAVAQVANIPQFSADMKMSGTEGRAVTGKMYWGGSRIRMDMDMQGHQAIMINDMPKKTSYMIMPQQKMYMELSATNPMAKGMGQMNDLKPYDPVHPCASMEGYTCNKVGTETVNGRSCEKWEFKGPQSSQTVWVDQKLYFPVRVVSTEGSTMDLTNIQEGSQPASLFEVPSGYTKMDMGGMMDRRPPD